MCEHCTQGIIWKHQAGLETGISEIWELIQKIAIQTYGPSHSNFDFHSKYKLTVTECVPLGFASTLQSIILGTIAMEQKRFFMQFSALMKKLTLQAGS